MSEISYDEVTATDLNNIAVDLGATTFSAFENSVPYAVTQLNDITAALVTSGILLSGSKCAVTVSDGKIYIADGVIVFASGAKIRITEVVSLDFVAGTYIYALNNTATNTAEIVVSETEPVEGDFVMLAAVDSDGALTDKRSFAMSKTLPIYVTDEEGNEVDATLLPTPLNYYVEKTVELTFRNYKNERKIKTLDIGWSGWNYVWVKNVTSDRSFSSVPGTVSPNGYADWEENIGVTKDGNNAVLEPYTYMSSSTTHTVTLVFM